MTDTAATPLPRVAADEALGQLPAAEVPEPAPVHAQAAPLQAPAAQARLLVDIALERHTPDRHAAIAYVREYVAADVAEGDPRMWAVAGHDAPMTGTSYHALILAEVDRLAVLAHPAEAIAAAEVCDRAEHFDTWDDARPGDIARHVAAHAAELEHAARIAEAPEPAPRDVHTVAAELRELHGLDVPNREAKATAYTALVRELVDAVLAVLDAAGFRDPLTAYRDALLASLEAPDAGDDGVTEDIRKALLAECQRRCSEVIGSE